MIYDISRTVRPTTAAWPGDTPYSVQTVLSIENGASVNLTALTFSPHVGTHADAYYHFEPDGLHPAAMPLEAYIGLARVVQTSREDGALRPEDFAPGALDGCTRLLVRSHVSDLADDQWPDQFPYLSVELVDYLAQRGARLIGLDSPSVDAFTSRTLPCHHAIMGHNMVHLESLLLRDVPPDDYELLALPLKLDSACASPVRAILRSLPAH